MTAKNTNRKPLAFGLIAIGFVFELAAVAYMVTAADGKASVPVGGLVLIIGLWMVISGATLLSKAQPH